METISVDSNNLKQLLTLIKDRQVAIKIYNHSAQWSGHFYRIEEIKDLQHGNYSLTIVILHDRGTSESTAMDMKTINLIELENPLDYQERKVQFVKVEKVKGA